MTDAQRQRDEETSAVADFIAIYRFYRRRGYPLGFSLGRAWHCVRRSP